MLTKYVNVDMKVAAVLDSPSKLAFFQPETYIPPEMQAAIDKVKQNADPRFDYLHLVAMTDGDRYGSNLNGDIFTAEELTGLQSATEAAKNKGDLQGVPVPRFKTFEQAKFFKNHANSDMDPHFGDVPCAAWNEVMRRVELLVRIAKQAIPEMGMSSGLDISLKYDRRGFITVSMGTTIAFEKCRVCGNQNEFISQRCPHLANQMNEVLPDGRLVSAENFGMRFFDISDVGVPADPGAYSMAKVASVAVPNRAEDADHHAAWRKRSEIEKQIPAQDAMWDVPPDSDATDDEPQAYEPEELQQMLAAAGGDLQSVLNTLTNSGVVLSPSELAQLTAHAEPGKTAMVDCEGFGRLKLDIVHPSVYAIARAKFASRSGFHAPRLRSGWECEKIAAQGFPDVADYYGFYRNSIRSLSASAFAKMAHRNPLVRELAATGSVKRALAFLTHTGSPV